MSVSILEVLENAGYDIRNNIDDARWLLGQRDEFETLCEEAGKFDDLYSDYEDFMNAQEEWNFDTPTFEEWRKELENGNE